MCFCVRAPVYTGVQTAATVLSLYLFLARFTILVRTGNSVDYSLAIRLLSLPWLSPLHHEIAWLSTGLERTSAKSPLFLHRSLSPFLSPPGFMWLPSGQHSTHTHTHTHTFTSAHTEFQTVWLAVQSLLPHFLWPFLYPHIWSKHF